MRSPTVASTTISYKPNYMYIPSSQNSLTQNHSPIYPKYYSSSPNTPDKPSKSFTPDNDQLSSNHPSNETKSNHSNSEDEDFKEIGTPSDLTQFKESILLDKQTELNYNQLVKDIIHQNPSNGALINLFLSASQPIEKQEPKKTINIPKSNVVKQISSNQTQLPSTNINLKKDERGKISNNNTKQQNLSCNSQSVSTPPPFPFLSDPFIQLAYQLTVQTMDMIPYADLNDGLYAKLSLHQCNSFRKLIHEKPNVFEFPFQYLSELASFEEPNSEALEMAFDPLNIGISSSITSQMLNSIVPPLKDLFTYQIEGPMTLKNWSQSQDFDETNFLEELTPPEFIVGYQDDWIKVIPSGMKLWEKIRLEPYSLKKNINYYLLCPNNKYLLSESKEFVKELSCIYDVTFFKKIHYFYN